MCGLRIGTKIVENIEVEPKLRLKTLKGTS